jgi:hypothetical protein
MQTVDVIVSAGAAVMVGGTVTEKTLKNISAATFEVVLGSETTPGTTWLTPNVSVQGPDGPHTRVVQLLVNSGNTSKGVYYLWVRVTDTPEILPLRFPNYQIVVR